MRSKLNRHLQLFISCGASSVGLLVATPTDVNIFRVLLYSRATSALLKLGQITGWYECAKKENEERYVTIETVICFACTMYLSYAYLFEVKAMPKNVISSITRACGLNKDEMRFFDSLRAIREI